MPPEGPHWGPGEESGAGPAAAIAVQGDKSVRKRSGEAFGPCVYL